MHEGALSLVLSNPLEQDDILSAKKAHTVRALTRSKYDNMLLLPYSSKQQLYKWIATRTKRELADTIIKILVENNIYIVN